jgi:hypothetical protein
MGQAAIASAYPYHGEVYADGALNPCAQELVMYGGLYPAPPASETYWAEAFAFNAATGKWSEAEWVPLTNTWITLRGSRVVSAIHSWTFTPREPNRFQIAKLYLRIYGVWEGYVSMHTLQCSSLSSAIAGYNRAVGAQNAFVLGSIVSTPMNF